MRTLLISMVAILLCVVTACHVGPQIQQLRMPVVPNGADVLIKVRTAGPKSDNEYRGELLEVSDDGLLIGLRADTSNDRRIAFVPWKIIYRAESAEVKGIRARVRGPGQTHDNSAAKFRLISRFPQGLSPELRNALLANFKQTDIVIIAE